MDKKTSAQIMYDYEVVGLSYRMLGKKYGIGHSHVYRMIKSNQKKQGQQKAEKVQDDELPDDVSVLKEALRKEKLKNELLNAVIDIASKELGVDIRKKSGTRQS